MVAAQHPDHRLEHRDVEPAATDVDGEEPARSDSSRLTSAPGGWRGDRHDRPAEQGGIVQLRREQHAAERLQGDGVEHAGRTEVEQREGAVGLDEDVAGMRIGVEHAVGEHLPEERREQPVGELVARHRHRVDRRGVGDRAARHLLEHEHAVRRHVLVHLGDPHPDVVLAVRPDPRLRSRLGREVELLLDRVGELAHQARRRRPRSPIVVRRCRNPASESIAWVSRDTMSAIPGRWTFTTTRSPVASTARCTWPIDAAASGSQSNDANTSSTGRPSSSSTTPRIPSADLRGDARLQLGELLDQRRGEEVAARRRDLAELHEHPAALLERRPQARPERGIGDPRHRREPAVQQALPPGDPQHLLEPQRRRERALAPAAPGAGGAGADRAGPRGSVAPGSRRTPTRSRAPSSR